MNKELELWQFIADRLSRGEHTMLLVVAESSGSSPGREGYKMAVGSDGHLCGSIGGGVMEVNLVEQSRATLAASDHSASNLKCCIQEQVHRKDSANSSGMICSGKQTVVLSLLSPGDLELVESVVEMLVNRTSGSIRFAPEGCTLVPKASAGTFERRSEIDFLYTEKLGFENELYIVGGGHCSLALSELMSKMDFHISIFDDRPDLNTIEKNRFAHEINVVESYDNIGDAIHSSNSTYVVVMTLGYRSDAIVIRQLVNKDFKYFGVLGSKAKMAILIKELCAEGISAERLDRIRTPIGLPINSHTPEEIAVSIAAEIISVKNA